MIKDTKYTELVIKGGKELEGEVIVSGAKNAALPLLIAVATSNMPVTLHNVPDISDIRIVCRMLERLGCKVNKNLKENYIHFDPKDLSLSREDIFEGAADIRASTLFIGALLERFGEVEIPLPGGDAIGKRPIDIHVFAFEKMGAITSYTKDTIIFKAPKGLHGGLMQLGFPSVGATENIMIAAARARGKTIIENAAREPEIINLAELLVSMGVKVRGAGTSTIEIEGIKEFQEAEATIIPDRIELFTFLCAAGLTGGEIICKNVFSNVLGAESCFLEQVGIQLVWQGSDLTAKRKETGLKSFELSTGPFPEFSTDNQPMALVVATQAHGKSSIKETMFENRYRHADELNTMGAAIVHNRTDFDIEGGLPLRGAKVDIADIRAGACLVLAALVADGESHLTSVYHILRGYQDMDKKLAKLGADIYFR
ncbi:MAG: UDP-N-acetylglucosamine 1-carboxyvinyltransferase [Alphaproteobacteria bacterium]